MAAHPSGEHRRELLRVLPGGAPTVPTVSFPPSRPVSFPPSRPGTDGEAGWAAAARKDPGRRAVVATATATVRAPYEPGLLALREGALREAAVRRLAPPPDVVLVDATGRDHPRRAGLALQLGAVLGLPTVGVTDRPLAARGEPPPERRGDTSPLWLESELVGFWVRIRTGVRPVAAHAGWRTTADQAVEVVLATATKARTPQPLPEAPGGTRRARRRRRVSRRRRLTCAPASVVACAPDGRRGPTLHARPRNP